MWREPDYRSRHTAPLMGKGGVPMGLRAGLARLFSHRHTASTSARIRARRGAYQAILDRNATMRDLNDLRSFATTRSGVEFYVEPQTTATTTSVAAVAGNGEWIRRRVGSPRVATDLARKLGVPCYAAAVVGYPAAMRHYRRT